MLVPFAEVFSQPSFHNFLFLIEGWVLAGARAMSGGDSGGGMGGVGSWRVRGP
jgi:hypothetical protein